MVICLAGLANALFSLPRKDAAVIVTWVIFTAVFAVPLLINNILGPACTCHLRTAVQIEELPSLSRVRRARKVLDRIRPFIIAVQGELPPEEIPSRMRSAIGATADVAPVPAGAALPPPTGDDSNAPPVLS